MTALPTLGYLRRHALPAPVLANLDLGCRSAAPELRQLSAARPRLVATWQVGAHGRPVCRWGVERAFSVPSG